MWVDRQPHFRSRRSCFRLACMLLPCSSFTFVAFGSCQFIGVLPGYLAHIIPHDRRYELPSFRPRWPSQAAHSYPRPSQAAQVQSRIETRPLQGLRATGPPLRLAVPGVTTALQAASTEHPPNKSPPCGAETSLLTLTQSQTPGPRPLLGQGCNLR
jgi:hypothetical protein